MAENLGEAVLELDVDEKPLIAGLKDAERRVAIAVAAMQAMLDSLEADAKVAVTGIEKTVGSPGAARSVDTVAIRDAVTEGVRQAHATQGSAFEGMWGVRGPQHPGSLRNPITVVIEAAKYQPMGAMAAAVGDQAMAAQGGAPQQSQTFATSQDVQDLSSSIEDLAQAQSQGPARPAGQQQADVDKQQTDAIQKIQIAMEQKGVGAQTVQLDQLSLDKLLMPYRTLAGALGNLQTLETVLASTSDVEGQLADATSGLTSRVAMLETLLAAQRVAATPLPFGPRTPISTPASPTTVYSRPGEGPMTITTPVSAFGPRPEAGGGGGGISGFLTNWLAAATSGGRGIDWNKILMGGFSWRSLLPPVAGMGSLAAFAGLGLEHYLTTLIGLAGSFGAAMSGGAALALGAFGKLAVGMGSDQLVFASTVADVKTLYTDLTNVSQAQAIYGKNSAQAQQAQKQLNYDMQQFGPLAGKADLAVAKLAQSTNTFWDMQTQAARVTADKILTQVLGLAHTFIPLVGQAAEQNLSIINQDIKPLFTWLQGPGGIGIFKDLETQFATQLPTAINAFVQGTQFFLRTMDVASHYTGGFISALDRLFTRLNNMSNLQINTIIGRLVTDFHVWLNFIEILGKDIYDIFHLDAQTGNSIINTLTGMLEKLHQWLQTTQAQADVRNIFVVHKDEIDALLHLIPPLINGFGTIYLTIAPPLTKALTGIVDGLVSIMTWIEKVFGPVGSWALGIAFITGKMVGFKTVLGSIGKSLAGMILGWQPLLNVLSKIPVIGPAINKMLNNTIDQNVDNMNVVNMRVGMEEGGVSPGQGTLFGGAPEEATAAEGGFAASLFAATVPLLSTAAIMGLAYAVISSGPVTHFFDSIFPPGHVPTNTPQGKSVLATTGTRAPYLDPIVQAANGANAATKAVNNLSNALDKVGKIGASVGGTVSGALNKIAGVTGSAAGAVGADLGKIGKAVSGLGSSFKFLDMLAEQSTKQATTQTYSDWLSYVHRQEALLNGNKINSTQYLRDTQQAFASYTNQIVTDTAKSYQGLFNNLGQQYAQHKITTAQFQTSIETLWKQASNTVTAQVNTAKEQQEAIWKKQAQDGQITWSQYWSNVHKLNASAVNTANTDMHNWAMQILNGMVASQSVGLKGVDAIAGQLNELLKGVGASKIPVPTGISVGSGLTGIGKSIPGAAGGGLFQIGQPGTAGRDNVPLNVGGMPITVGEGEQVAVFNRHQLPVVNYALGMAGYGGGLSGLFAKVNTPNYMSRGGMGYSTGGYVFPFPPGFTWGRTDMGVDGDAPVGAPFGPIGDARILNIQPNWFSGQPNIWWQLLNGPDAGHIVYLGEQITPAVHAGQIVKANQAIAHFAPSGTGIEMGWGAPGDRTASQAAGTEGSFPTPQGLAFRAFLSGLAHGKLVGGGPGFASINAPHVEGSGVITTMVQDALNKGTAAANAYAMKKTAALSGTGSFTGSNIPAASGPVMRQMLDEGQKLGMTRVAVAGMIGNAVQESSLNPNLNIATGKGLFSWDPQTNPSGAASVILGNVPEQVAEAVSQLTGGVSGIDAMSSPAAAAEYWEHNFEHAGNPQMQNRIAAANSAYAQGYARGGFPMMFARGGGAPKHSGGGHSGHSMTDQDRDAWTWIHHHDPFLTQKAIGKHWLDWLGKHMGFNPIPIHGKNPLNAYGVDSVLSWVGHLINHTIPQIQERESQLSSEWTIKGQSPSPAHQKKLIDLDRAALSWILLGVQNLDKRQGPIEALIDQLSKAKGKGSDLKQWQNRHRRLNSELNTLTGLSGIGGMLGDATTTLRQALNQGGNQQKQQDMLQLLQQKNANLIEKNYLMRQQYKALENFLNPNGPTPYYDATLTSAPWSARIGSAPTGTVTLQMPPFGGSYAQGGVVPGPTGAPRTIIAHGGERVGNAEVCIYIEKGAGVDPKKIRLEIEKEGRKMVRHAHRGLPSRGGGRLVTA